MDALTYLIYGVPCAALFAWQMARRRRLEKRSAAVKDTTGAAEPASLHPVIDPTRCIGCGSCVKACPEEPEHHYVLGIIGGRAHLVSPGDCIGHGACKAACPVEAISLVFGTERRGADIPILESALRDQRAGNLHRRRARRHGLHPDALEQGRQARESSARAAPRGRRAARPGDRRGRPAAFAAALTAKSKQMRLVILEQETLGRCVFQYPRGKLADDCPGNGAAGRQGELRQTSKEARLRVLAGRGRRKTGIRSIIASVWTTLPAMQTSSGSEDRLGDYWARSVLLAIGRRGTPASWGCPARSCPRWWIGSSIRISTRAGRRPSSRRRQRPRGRGQHC